MTWASAEAKDKAFVWAGVGEMGWEDRTAALKKACASMDKGKMVHGESFTLFESMSAIELMDAKMDPRYRAHTFKDAYEMTNNINKDFSLEYVLQCITMLMRMEHAFLEGAAVVHSIFSCAYVHRKALDLLRQSKSIWTRAFVAYAAATLHCCQLAIQLVTYGDVYEEEDFVIHTFRVDMSGGVTRDAAITELKSMILAVEEEVQKDPLAQSIYDLMQFRLHLLQGLATVFASDVPTFESICSFLSSLEPMRPALMAEHQDVDMLAGFDDTLTRDMVPNSPPRNTIKGSWKDVVCFWTIFIDSLSDALTTLQRGPSIDMVELVLIYQTMSNKYHPTCFVRSMLLLLLQSQASFFGGASSVASLLKESIHNFCPLAPVATALLSKSQEAPAVLRQGATLLSERIAQPTCRLFRLFCENRSRQYCSIPAILQEWGIAQRDAALMDQHVIHAISKSGIAIDKLYRNAYLCYMVNISLMLQCHYIHLGLEQQLYSPYELPIMYWYAGFLHDVRVQTVYSCSRVDVPQLKRGKVKGKAITQTVSRGIDHNLVLLEAYRNMCYAMTRMLEMLKRMKLISPLKSSFTSKRRTFAFRTSPFSALRDPQQLTYDDYESIFAKQDTEKLRTDSIALFNKTRPLLDILLKSEKAPAFRHEAKSMLHVCVANSVAMLTFHRTLEKLGSSTRAVLNFPHHAAFPVLELQGSVE